MKHELKILPNFFWDVKSGRKSFELRKNDRDFHVGDTLVLKEWDGEKYTGEELERKVGYILHGTGEYGLAEGYCVIALKRGTPIVFD